MVQRFAPVDNSLKLAGKTYKHNTSYSKKTQANKLAKDFRKAGLLARVIMYNKTLATDSPKIYAVFVRAK